MICSYWFSSWFQIIHDHKLVCWRRRFISITQILKNIIKKESYRPLLWFFCCGLHFFFFLKASVSIEILWKRAIRTFIKLSPFVFHRHERDLNYGEFIRVSIWCQIFILSEKQKSFKWTIWCFALRNTFQDFIVAQ